MLLDTNAAKLYRPAVSQPATTQPVATQTTSELGDPSLAIDGATKTSWTVKVSPETAPKVGVGATIDMHSLSAVSQLVLITSTPGSTIQVYGTRLKKPPASLTSKDWTKLTGMHVLSKHRSIVDLRYSKRKQFRQLLIWIVKAPRSSTRQAPGQVSIDEVTLYEPK